MTTTQWNEAKESFAQLCETIAALRHPVTGCPWDLEQTHATLRRYMIEEAYEAAEVMEPANPALLVEELGDVLLQVVLNAQLASDAGTFKMKDVIDGIESKMRRRHPHVFGDKAEQADRNRDSIRSKWATIKAAEKSSTETLKSEGVFSAIKAGSTTPAAMQAVSIGKIARTIQFDWPSPQAVLEQVKSELREVEVEVVSEDPNKGARIYEEMGDLYFSLAQLCRQLGIDPETCALDGNKKFLGRFRRLENIASINGIDVQKAGTEKLELLWLEAKKQEKAGNSQS